jgi:hypothetical protein
MKPENIVSAQVVLVAAGGARPNSQTRITSENIHEWTPSSETIGRVSAGLREMGFKVGETVGHSLSITGPARLFESSFRTKLSKKGKGVQFAGDGYELAAKKIPSALRDQIAAITFTPPPDFGPDATGSFS